MKKRVVELSAKNRKEVLKLIVNPKKIEFTDPQNNQQVQLLDVGTVNLLGEKGVISITLSSFFPSQKSPIYKRLGGKKTPKECKRLVKKWKDNKTIVRLIISDLDINLAMSIDEFDYSQNEGDYDIYYSIKLTEYKKLNVSSVKSSKSKSKKGSISKRPSSRSSKGNNKIYTVKSGDTLWAISVKYYKKGSQYKKIYNANKKVIEATAKKHKRKSSQNGHWIYPGTKLVIP